ncbi:hypothetical protein LTR49_013591 [Elasticomyces elasticus]|nr:hypothetical protein LTR49_013591 [Elasticomyces elasticus]
MAMGVQMDRLFGPPPEPVAPPKTDIVRILSTTTETLPRYLFRAWSNISGGNPLLNTVEAITPHAFLDGGGPAYINQIPPDELVTMWQRHLIGTEFESVFSSWSHSLAFVAEIASSHIEYGGGGAHISVIDTTTLAPHNFVAHTTAPALKDAGVASHSTEFLVFGIVSGGAHRAVSVADLAKAGLPLAVLYLPGTIVGATITATPDPDIATARVAGQLFGPHFELAIACFILGHRCLDRTSRSLITFEHFARTMQLMKSVAGHKYGVESRVIADSWEPLWHISLVGSTVANYALLISHQVPYTMPTLGSHDALGMRQAATIKTPRYLFRAWSPAPGDEDFGSLTISGGDVRFRNHTPLGIFAGHLTQAPTDVAISSWTQSIDHALARASALANCGDGEVLSILDTHKLANENVVLHCVNALAKELPTARPQIDPEMQDDSELFGVRKVTRAHAYPTKLLIFGDIPRGAWVAIVLNTLRTGGLDELLMPSWDHTHLKPERLQARIPKAMRLGEHFGPEFQLTMTCFVALPRSRFYPASEQHIHHIASRLAPAYDVPRSWLDVYDPDQTFPDTTQALRLMRAIAEFKYGVHASVVGWDDESRRHMGLMYAGPLQKRGPQGKPYWWKSEELVGDAKPVVPMKHENETEPGVMLAAAERSPEWSRGGAGSNVVKTDNNDAKIKKEEDEA